MDKKPNEIHKNLIPQKLTTILYYTTQTYLVTGQQVPSWIVNTYTSLFFRFLVVKLF